MPSRNITPLHPKGGCALNRRVQLQNLSNTWAFTVYKVGDKKMFTLGSLACSWFKQKNFLDGYEGIMEYLER